MFFPPARLGKGAPSSFPFSLLFLRAQLSLEGKEILFSALFDNLTTWALYCACSLLWFAKLFSSGIVGIMIECTALVLTCAVVPAALYTVARIRQSLFFTVAEILLAWPFVQLQTMW